jgi:hypothetical protein
MRKFGGAIVALVLSLGAPLLAADVTGVLVDKACYTKDKAATTNAHPGMGDTCAQDCAKKGNVVALVTKDGEVYEVMAMGGLAGQKNAKLVPHMGHTVTLTGMIAGTPDKKMIHATGLKMVSK